MKEGQKVCGLRNLLKAFIWRALPVSVCLCESAPDLLWENTKMDHAAIRNCQLLKAGLLKTDPREGLNDAYLLNDRPRERKTEWEDYTDSILRHHGCTLICSKGRQHNYVTVTVKKMIFYLIQIYRILKQVLKTNLLEGALHKTCFQRIFLKDKCILCYYYSFWIELIFIF